MDATLHAALAEAWHRLASGVADRRGPFRTPALATIAADGAPALRTVVLRAVDASARRMTVHTDVRAEKVAQLQADPRAALLFWDADAQLQLRIDAHATLYADDTEAWAALHPRSRAVYAQPLTPGAPIASPPPAPADDSGARDNFAVLHLHVTALEWLRLAPEGHRRARFTWPDTGPAATWLVP